MYADLARSDIAADDATPRPPWALLGQVTNVTQGHGRFTSPYSGDYSLQSDGRTEETTDVTLYAGLRLWRGAEVWLDLEVDQGRGLDNTVGVAGFPSGEAYKVGANAPYPRLPRAFFRQTVDLGGERTVASPAFHVLGGEGTADALTFTIGKFAVTDVFDANAFAHDPRSDFLNWAIVDAGAFDYAADPWGFTYGAAVELAEGSRTWRAGAFQLSKVPNDKIVRVDPAQFMLVSEFEQRYEANEATGKIKLLAFLDRARIAKYRDAVQFAIAQGSAGTTPDVAGVRRRATKAGVALNVEHAFNASVGAFLRASCNDGAKEAYEFTEINRSWSGGVSIKGGTWGRPDDTLGLAGAANGLSGDARAYFGAGGLGILIGDGRLRYGREKIVEAYYAFRPYRQLALTLDWQHVANQAYNRDRGPVFLYAVRAHAEF